MPSAVITGVAGRLGQSIARCLRKNGWEVIGVDRTSRSALDCVGAANVQKYVRCDLAGDPVVVHRTLKETLVGSDVVIHCAGWPGPAADPPPAVLKSGDKCANARIGLEDTSPVNLLRDNISMTAAVCDAAVDAGVARVIFSSSAFGFGWSHVAVGKRGFRLSKLPLDESSCPRPFESYGLSKIGGEMVLDTAARTAKEVSFVSLRFPNIIKRENWECLPWAVPLTEEPLPLLMWPYVHEDDVVDAHVSAATLEDAAQPGMHEVYVVAAPDTRFDVPTESLLTKFQSVEPAPARIEGRSSILSSEKAITRLGIRPRSWDSKYTNVELPEGSARNKGSKAAIAARTDERLEHFSLEGFQLESGIVLEAGATLAYKIYGAMPNYEVGRGLVLHATSFDAVHTDVESEIGPGKMLDTDKYCVVVPNMMGNGVSFSPSTPPQYPHSRSNHPALITIADNVRAQSLALADKFGSNAGKAPNLDLIYGYSMGALQALEWAVRFPDSVKRVAAICGSARCSPINTSFLLSLEAALCADSKWRNCANGAGFFEGTPRQGLLAFARIYSGWGVSSRWYEDEVFKKFGYASAEQFVRESYETGFENSDAGDLLAQLRTWRAADVSHPFGGNVQAAMSRITAQVLYMPCDGDRYFTTNSINKESSLVTSIAPRVSVISSPFGHRAGDPWNRVGVEGVANQIRDEVKGLLGTTVQ